MEYTQNLLKIALLGTNTTNLDNISLHEPIRQILNNQEFSDKEEQFLQAAILTLNYEMAGITFPSISPPSISKTEGEDQAYCSLAMEKAFVKIIANSKEMDVWLPKWLKSCISNGHIAPPQFLPKLLSIGKKKPQLRSFIKRVIGNRGMWLARQNSEWEYVQMDEKALWEIGSLEERKLLLQETRRQNPSQGRQMLEDVWKEEKAQVRASFLEILIHGLSTEDEVFLEKCQKDKSKYVKQVANRLLQLIPEGKNGQLVWKNIQSYIKLEEKRRFLSSSKQLLIQPPQSFPEELIGLELEMESPDKKFSDQEYILFQLLTQTPLEKITQHLNKPIKEILKLFYLDKKHNKYVPALVNSSITFKNSEWTQQLLTFFLHREQKPIRAEISTLFSLLKQEDWQVWFSSNDYRTYINNDFRIYDFLLLAKNEWTLQESAKALETLYDEYADKGIYYQEMEKIVRLAEFLHPDTFTQRKDFEPPADEKKGSWRNMLAQIEPLLEIKKAMKD